MGERNCATIRRVETMLYRSRDIEYDKLLWMTAPPPSLDQLVLFFSWLRWLEIIETFDEQGAIPCSAEAVKSASRSKPSDGT